MKTFILILLTAVISAAAVFVIVSNQKESAFKKDRAALEAAWQAEKATLESALASAKKKSGRVERIVEPGAAPAPTTTKITAKEILEELLKLKPTGTTRSATFRKIIYYLEELAMLSDEAVPEIGKFLALSQDIDYSPERTEENRGDGPDRRGGGGTPPWIRTRATTEFTLPPSLRMGLFDVLKQIGGEESEVILGQVLGTTGRAVEVAYLARLLEEVAPGKYREVALEAAKSLLRNPLAVDNPSRLDENAEGYLYGVLEMYKDTTFSEDAKKLMVNTEGRLNRSARDYLVKTQGEQAIPALMDAFKNSSLSNNFDKMSLGGNILDFVGANSSANEFLNEIVSNTELDPRMRAFSVMRLAGGFGQDSPTDPKEITSKMQVVEALRGSTTEPDVLRAIDSTQKNLQNLLDGKPVENNFRGGRGGPRPGQTTPGAPPPTP